MTNLYIFWKKVEDPPSPWTRLTRTNKYIRFNNNTSNHWTDVGSTTHTHTSVSGFSCDNGSQGYITTDMFGTWRMGIHNHAEPSSWTISTNNNNPLGYGLDIIYTEITYWETNIKYFPEGSVLMSNGSLVDAELSRFTSADGKYIVHGEPGTSFGTDTAQGHTISGTTGSSGTDGWKSDSNSILYAVPATHTHTISVASQTKYVEPANLVTRLYYTLCQTSKAVSGTVAFVNGTPSANWEVLTTWSGGNLKPGNSDPTLSGSDTHTQTFSGNTSSYNNTGYGRGVAGEDAICNLVIHSHAISGTLGSATHIPASKYIIAARLLNTLYADVSVGPQIIGLNAW